MNTRIAMHLQTHRGQYYSCELMGWGWHLWWSTKLISPFHLWTDGCTHSQLMFPGGALIQKLPPTKPTHLIRSQLAAHESDWFLRVTLTSYCALLEFVELTLDEAEHQAGLPNGRLPQQHQFKLTDLGPGVGSIGSRGTSPTGHGLLRSPGVLWAKKLCVRTSAARKQEEKKTVTGSEQCAWAHECYS